MVGTLILRGLMVGLVAGLLGFVFAKSYGEPAVNVAIAFESAMDAAKAKAAVAAGEKPDAPDVVIWSRAVQGGIGLFTGVVSVGIGLGGLFAVLFAFLVGRLGALSVKATAAVIALLGLVSLYVVPALKYPANPPSVGQPDTIALRTGLYFLMIVLSIGATVVALAARKRLIPRFGAWNASLLSGVLYLVLLSLFFVLMPAINEVPADFPAVILWHFRLASLGIQTILWLGIGLMFGYAAEPVLATLSYQAGRPARL